MKLPCSDKVYTTRSITASPERQRLLAIKAGLDDKLTRYNPGEKLSWNIAEDAFELPETTIARLRAGGPALQEFFRVANELFYREPWIRERLEKSITPHYHRLNRAQQGALPHMPRPDVVLDQHWNPKFVELEITVGSRADTSIMAEQYGLDAERSLVRHYARHLQQHWPGQTLALVTAPHPFFLDLPDDAQAFASLLRREGLQVIVLTGSNLVHLRFDGEQLWLCHRDGPPQAIAVFDRFIDIYEIAELQHPGMAPLLDAYLAGAISDVNTCKQFLDEKEWMCLFWEPQLRNTWQQELGAEQDGLLQQLIPRTWSVAADTRILLNSGETVPITQLGQVPKAQRNFLTKESGTSTTSSGAQSVTVLSDLSNAQVEQFILRILHEEVPYVLQEIIESPRVSFTALDPYNDEVIVQHGARTKLSVFYVNGLLTDIRFIASNVKLAVNDEDYVAGVIRH